MNAETQLLQIAKAFHRYGLDAVMVGNAGAVLNGAPVTTLDIDFVVEQTPENYRKIMAIASFLHCKVYEAKLKWADKYIYTLENEEKSIFLDILHNINGFDNVQEIRKNACEVDFGGFPLKIASLKDILHSKKVAGRDKDLIVIPILEKTQHERESAERAGIHGESEGQGLS